MKSNDFLRYTFKFICFTTAFSMAGYWIFKFSRNEDITLIEYKAIKDLGAISLPSTSICFIIKQADLHQNNKENSFDHNELRFTEYLDHILVMLRHGRPYNCTIPCKGINFISNFNGTFNIMLTRCFEIQIEAKYSSYVFGMSLNFKAIMISLLNQIEMVFVHFHHPGQLYRDFRADYIIWKNPRNYTHFTAFKMDAIEVLRRRSKPNEKCLKDVYRYDEMKLEKIIERTGCKAKYHSILDDYPICKDEEELANFEGSNMGNENFLLPCEEMSHISFKTLDHGKDYGYGFYPLHVAYPEKMKIITQKQAIDIHALIGNIGGYIGLFLG